MDGTFRYVSHDESHAYSKGNSLDQLTNQRAYLKRYTTWPFSFKMNLVEDISFYGTQEASSKEEKLIPASFGDKGFGVRRMSLEDEASFESLGTSFEVYGAISCVDHEEPIEAFFFEETFASPMKKSELETQLDNVLRSFRPAFMVVEEVKEEFTKELNQQGIPVRDLDGFNLDIMGVLNRLDKGDPVGTFLRQAYIGCFQCVLCLESDGELRNTGQLLGHHLLNAMSVLKYVLSRQGISIPDQRSEKMDYDLCKLNHLARLTDTYLHLSKSIPDYQFLRKHEQLIKDYQVVSEIDLALKHLRDEFEKLRKHPHEVSFRSDNLTLFSEIEDDLSLCC